MGKTHVPQKKVIPALCINTNEKQVNVKYDFVYLNIFVLYQAVFR